MSDGRGVTPDRESEKGSLSEIFRDGHGLYSALVIGGIAMQATQMLVIAIIMPTIVGDIGGADYYTWAAMLYTIGAIVGASSGMPRGDPACPTVVRPVRNGSSPVMKFARPAVQLASA